MPGLVKCVNIACNSVFRSHEEMREHFVQEWEDNKSHDYCKPCRYMAKTWDELTDHKANSTKFHLCCKFCGEEFRVLKSRDDHIKKLHPMEQDLRCIGCKEHFVRGHALVGHLEFDNCRKIKAAQFKAAFEHKALINKMLEDPDYVRGSKNAGSAATATATAGSTYADTDFDDSSTVGGVSMSILDDDTLSIADSQEGGGVRIRPLVPAVQSPIRQVQQNVQNVQRISEQFPALPGRENIRSTPRAAVATPLRRVEDFPALPGAKKGSMSPPTRALSQVSLASSSATQNSPWKSRSDAWETSSQVSEVLFKGTGQATAAQRLFKDTSNTPMNEVWRIALAERDLEYDDRLRCNPFLLRFWDPDHPEYNPERFFNKPIGKYICPLKKCDAHFFEPSKITEHLMGKHVFTQVRCPTCLKLFNSCSALLSHCENASSECNVARTRDFYKVVDLYSGGFLSIVDAHRDDITAQDMRDREDYNGNIILKSGMKDDYIKYIATVPHDWAGAGSESAKQGITIGKTWGDCSVAMRRNHGTMDPSVPLSNSRRFARTTASIYPELVYEEGDTPDTLSSTPDASEPGASGTGKGKGKYKPANYLIDPVARRDPTGIYMAPETMTPMMRSEMKYAWELDEETKMKEKEKKDQ